MGNIKRASSLKIEHQSEDDTPAIQKRNEICSNCSGGQW